MALAGNKLDAQMLRFGQENMAPGLNGLNSKASRGNAWLIWLLDGIDILAAFNWTDYPLQMWVLVVIFEVDW